MRGYGSFRVRQESYRAHRIAWALTRGPVPTEMLVCHTCDNTSCVRPEHLYVGTHADNMRDRHQRGRTARGDRHGSRLHPELVPRGERASHAVLTADAVREIRRLYAGGGHSHCTLAALYDVHPTTVGSILRRTTWAHVA